MWFQVTDQPLFAVAGLWQPVKDGLGFTRVTCDPNELVAPIRLGCCKSSNLSP